MTAVSRKKYVRNYHNKHKNRINKRRRELYKLKQQTIGGKMQQYNNINTTKINLNENIVIEIKLPKEVDIATFEGTYEIVRRIGRAVSPMTSFKMSLDKRTDKTGRKVKWTEEKAKYFMQDSNFLTTEQLLDKYNLTTVDPERYIAKLKYYLKSRFEMFASGSKQQKYDRVGKYNKWTEEKARDFLRDSKVLSTEQLLGKYNITSSNAERYILRMRDYLKSKFSIGFVKIKELKKWSDEEVQLLKKYVQVHHRPFKEVAKLMNRNFGSIKSKVVDLKRQGGWYNENKTTVQRQVNT